MLTVDFEPGAFHLRSERAKRWAIRADKYWSRKGDCVIFHFVILGSRSQQVE